MDITMLLRSVFILLIAIILHILTNIRSLAPNLIMFPIILAISPYIASKLPLLGTKSLMESGIQPLFSLLLITGLTVLVTLSFDFMKNSENNEIGSLLQSLKPLVIGPIQIQSEFVIISVCVLFLELIFQEIYSKKRISDENKKLEAVFEKVLTKFTTCKIVNKNK